MYLFTLAHVSMKRKLMSESISSAWSLETRS